MNRIEAQRKVLFGTKSKSISTPIEYQTIKDESGNPAFVVMPYTEFLRLREQAGHLVPQEVVEEMTPIRAWREHLRLTQTELASRMAISQSAFAQMEALRCASPYCARRQAP